MSVKDLLQVQVGTESTWGTPVTPTARLMGMDVDGVRLSAPGYEAEVNADMRASLAPGVLAHLDKVDGAAVIPGKVTYEDICYFLDNAFGQATPSGVGPYTRAYAGPLGTAPAPRVLTVGYGDSNGAYRLEGGLVNRLSVSGQYGSPLTFNANFIGQQVTNYTIATLSDRSVGVVMGNHGLVYVDAFGGTAGTTQIASTAWAFEYTIELNRVLAGYFGALAPGNYYQPRWKVMLKLSLEFNATSKAYQDLLLAASPALFQRLVRLDFDSGANLEFRIDFAGTATSAPEVFADRDGVAAIDLEMEATYDSGPFAGYTRINSINNVSVLP